MNRELILEEAWGLRDWLVEIRRDFHRNPELGMEEYRTANKIGAYLKELNIPYEAGIANTGLVGLIQGKYEGKTVALRADMDALPMDDEKIVDYKSQIKGKMHSCGHDGHMTILLGAAKILSSKRDTLRGNVKLLFQPAEESVGGAKPMIEQGVMLNPKVDAVLGLHVTPEIPVGQIGVKFGQMNAASDSIRIILHGTSVHGAYPHGGIDTIVMAGQVITALQTIVSRNVDPRDSAVITLGKISGGTKGNIIANKVEMIGTVRTIHPVTREKVIERIRSMIKQIAEAMGGRAELEREKGYPALINEDSMVTLVKNTAINLLGSQNVLELKNISLGVEDFAYFLQEVPGAFYRLGCGNEEKGIVHDGHSNGFDIDEDCLVYGTALQAVNALSVLEEKQND